jgi:hypothetical protein
MSEMPERIYAASAIGAMDRDSPSEENFRLLFGGWGMTSETEDGHYPPEPYIRADKYAELEAELKDVLEMHRNELALISERFDKLEAENRMLRGACIYPGANHPDDYLKVCAENKQLKEKLIYESMSVKLANDRYDTLEKQYDKLLKAIP